MTYRRLLGLLAVLPTAAAPAASFAADVKEIATFEGNGALATAVALSADGSRLVVTLNNAVADKTGLKIVAIPGELAVWDVAGGQQLWVRKEPKARFTHAWMSADGKTVVTVRNGFDTGDSAVSWAYQTQVRADGGYQAWDAATGKPVGPPIAPARPGEFTAAAMSADGKWLATVYNGEVIPPDHSSIVPFKVGDLIVWDLESGKAKWKAPGKAVKGRVSWQDRLAFSPDGARLACTGGPVSEPADLAPGRPPSNYVKILTLDPDQETPAAKTLELHGADGSLEWSAGGKFLLVRDGRQARVFDPTTGREKDSFGLAVPRPPAPKPPPGVLPLPPPFEDREPGHEQTVLSADGSRLAALFLPDPDDRPQGQPHVVVWDFRGRRVVGTVKLPNDPFGFDARNKRKDISTLPGTRDAIRIALSGDGSRLAVSDWPGAVHVYDLSKLGAAAKTPPGDGPDAAEEASVEQAYKDAVAKARERLLAGFDSCVRRAEGDPSDSDEARARRKDLVAALTEEKARFEKHGLVSWREPMRDSLSEYLDSLAEARAQALAHYKMKEPPAGLRELMGKQVIARWKHRPGNGVITLYSDGRINEPDGDNRWSFKKGQLVFRWKDAKAPGGYWVDACAVAADGGGYAGANQIKTKVSGTLVKDD